MNTRLTLGQAALAMMPIVAGLAAALVIVASSSCSVSSEATANGDDPDWSASTADPEFLRRAADALDSYADDTPEGARLAVVLAEDDKGYDARWVVLGRNGDLDVLTLAWGCEDDGDSTGEDDLYLLLDPGDLITWTTDGDDTAVCTGEVVIREKAAAAAPARPS